MTSKRSSRRRRANRLKTTWVLRIYAKSTQQRIHPVIDLIKKIFQSKVGTKASRGIQQMRPFLMVVSRKIPISQMKMSQKGASMISWGRTLLTLFETSETILIIKQLTFSIYAPISKIYALIRLQSLPEYFNKNVLFAILHNLTNLNHPLFVILIAN